MALNPKDIQRDDSFGNSSMPLMMRLTHRPTAQSVCGTGRPEHSKGRDTGWKLYAELLGILDNIVAVHLGNQPDAAEPTAYREQGDQRGAVRFYDEAAEQARIDSAVATALAKHAEGEAARIAKAIEMSQGRAASVAATPVPAGDSTTLRVRK